MLEDNRKVIKCFSALNNMSLTGVLFLLLIGLINTIHTFPLLSSSRSSSEITDNRLLTDFSDSTVCTHKKRRYFNIFFFAFISFVLFKYYANFI